MDSLSQSEAENVPLSDLMDLGSDLPSEQRRKHRQSFYQHKCEQCQRQRNGCVSDAMSGYSSKTFEPMSTHRGHRDSPAVGVRQRFSQIFTEENKPRLLTYARYAIIFLIGFALGLVPFIKQYVDNCEANHEIINKLIEEHRALHNISLVTGTASAFTGPKLVRRTALAIGNKEIRLYCNGAIQIEGVEAFGVSGKLETIRRFNAYCKSHVKYEKNMNQCDVSLARVYGTNFPQVDSVTKVTYLCREKKR